MFPQQEKHDIMFPYCYPMLVKPILDNIDIFEQHKYFGIS